MKGCFGPLHFRYIGAAFFLFTLRGGGQVPFFYFILRGGLCGLAWRIVFSGVPDFDRDGLTRYGGPLSSHGPYAFLVFL